MGSEMCIRDRQVTIAETREAAFIKELIDACGDVARTIAKDAYAAVSYTHLTLPTSDLV